jgi:hypothetical protein
MELLICAGYVDAKVEATVEMQGRLGSLRLIYHCHGPCYDLVDNDVREDASHVREWGDANGMIAGRLTITKRPLAVRLSAKSIDKFKLDQPDERQRVIPLLVDKLVERLGDSDGFLHDSPEIALVALEQTARTGPDSNSEGVFYWSGHGYRLAKRNWQILCAIWGHTEVNIADVGELVWQNEFTPEATIRKQINRLNQQLATMNIPLAWRIEARQIRPEM